MRKTVSLLLGISLIMVSCSQKQSVYTISSDFKDCKSVTLDTAFYLDTVDEIKSFSWVNNDLCVENNQADPVFTFYQTDGQEVGHFGHFGHGKNEFVLPNIFVGINDSIMVLDGMSQQLYSLYGNKICSSKKLNVERMDEVKTINWPYIGYYCFERNQIAWKIYDLEKSQVVDTICFVGEKPYLEVFKWDVSSNGKVVFAYKYYHKFMICDLLADTKIVNKNIFLEPNQKPQDSKCYYTDIACSSDFFILLSLADVDARDISNAKSRIEIYDYDGNPLKQLTFNGLYLHMAWNDSEKRLYLVPLDGGVINYLQL